MSLAERSEEQLRYYQAKTTKDVKIIGSYSQLPL